MIRICILATLAIAALAVPTEKINTSPHAFDAYLQEYGKAYASEAEYNRRYQIFQENVKIIEKHNSEGHSWWMGLTQFADMTPKEFEEMQTLFNSTIGTDDSSAPFRHSTAGRSVDDLPSSVDWRTKNLVNKVKNQGQCGSCWAFSTVVSLEGQVAKKTGTLESYSEQDLVDCVKNQKLPNDSQVCCDGCQGGLMDFAFAYMIDKQDGKDDTEAAYPYKGVDGTCNYKKSGASVAVTKWTDIAQGDEDSLKDAVATVGPISIAVNANMFWQLYRGGVFNPIMCGGSRLNHGVAIVGYGTENGKDYWIIRNSWGEIWGEQGYMRIVAGKNECGLANSACYPTVA